MKNKYEILGNVTLIHIKSQDGRISFTKIDTADLEKVKAHPNKWSAYYDRKAKKYYVRSTLHRKTVQLHRLIMDEPFGLVVDHKNHDTLDNRRSNLNPVTIQQNAQNKKGALKNSTSGVRGVSWNSRSKKWLVYFMVNKKKTYFGGFETLDEAEKHATNIRNRIYYTPDGKLG